MKKREIDNTVTVKGYYVSEFVRGFYGERNEGGRMLNYMGLNSDELPFSVAQFLKTRSARWPDVDENLATISFVLKPNQLECFGTYLGKKKSYRLFVEWGARENPEVIAQLESEAIGDLCMKCIYDNLDDI